LVAFLHTVWSAPLVVVLSITFLYQLLGISVFVGLSSMLLVLPVSAVCMGKLSEMQEDLMKIKDERLKLTNEVLSNIKIIKLYAWEKSFGERIAAVRSRGIFDRPVTFFDFVSQIGCCLFLCLG
jgi:hypothetical protein